MPQMKSLAGVAANTRPFAVTFSPCVATARIAVLPAFATLPSAFSTMFARPPRLLPGVVLALRSAAAARQVFVVPAHLADQVARHVGGGGARRQQVDGIAHLGDFGEHHRGAGAHQQVGRIAHRGIAGDAGERVAAAALQAHHQFRRRARSARAPAVQFRQALLGGRA